MYEKIKPVMFNSVVVIIMLGPLALTEKMVLSRKN